MEYSIDSVSRISKDMGTSLPFYVKHGSAEKKSAPWRIVSHYDSKFTMVSISISLFGFVTSLVALLFGVLYNNNDNIMINNIYDETLS